MSAPDDAALQALLPTLVDVYHDLHQHPELSMQEVRTAGIAADWLRARDYDVTTGVGGTGVVGVLANGEGPTVLLRADMDALPMAEDTGLPYASTEPVMHSCGHDVHVTCLMGAAHLLAASRDRWQGTVLAVFQPGEETAEGARAMLADGLLERFPRPDICLGQHVMAMPLGRAGIRAGTMLSAGDSLRVRLFGRGGHGSTPQTTVDPVVLAASTVMRLQGIVAREVGPNEAAVVTVGSLQAGTKENIIPDHAELKINIRTFDTGVRERVLAAVERIVHAEARASGCPREPELETISSYPLTTNDPTATDTVREALRAALGPDRVVETEPWSASEDFGAIGTAAGVPSVFWFFGGTEPDEHGELPADAPGNHSPQFAPVAGPTVETGSRAMYAAALAGLG